PGFDIAFEVFAEGIEPPEVCELLADHPDAAPGLVRSASFGQVEIDLFDGRALVPQLACRLARDGLDLGVDPDAGDVASKGDAQALGVARLAHDAGGARPGRCDGNRRQASE